MSPFITPSICGLNLFDVDKAGSTARTWESVLYGAIPVVLHLPSMEKLYENSPVMVVRDWREVGLSGRRGAMLFSPLFHQGTIAIGRAELLSERLTGQGYVVFALEQATD